jgi:hypothetical protein
MKTISRSILFVPIAALLAVSCKDDDAKPSKTELITAKSWTVTSFTLGGQDFTEYFSEDCEKDDASTFGKDGKVTIDNGTVKCYSSEPQTEESGTWAFESNETKIKLTSKAGDVETYNVDELTATTLKVSSDFSDTVNGVKISGKLVITLTAK